MKKPEIGQHVVIARAAASKHYTAHHDFIGREGRVLENYRFDRIALLDIPNGYYRTLYVPWTALKPVAKPKA